MGAGRGVGTGAGLVQLATTTTSHQPGSISLTIHFLDWAGGRGAPGPGRRAGPSRHWAWLATSRGARARAGAGLSRAQVCRQLSCPPTAPSSAASSSETARGQHGARSEQGQCAVTAAVKDAAAEDARVAASPRPVSPPRAPVLHNQAEARSRLLTTDHWTDNCRPAAPWPMWSAGNLLQIFSTRASAPTVFA